VRVSDNVKARKSKKSHNRQRFTRPEIGFGKKLSPPRGLGHGPPPPCYVFLHLPFLPRRHRLFILVTWSPINGMFARGGRPGPPIIASLLEPGGLALYPINKTIRSASICRAGTEMFDGAGAGNPKPRQGARQAIQASCGKRLDTLGARVGNFRASPPLFPQPRGADGLKDPDSPA